MLNKMQVKLSNIRGYPTVAITIVAAIILVVLGIYSMIPAAVFGGVAVGVAYPITWVRIVAGLLIMLPALPILYWNIKDDLSTYLLKENRTRKWLFWMGVTYFYLTMYRMLWAGLFPPLWVLYLGFGLVIMIIWMGVKR